MWNLTADRLVPFGDAVATRFFGAAGRYRNDKVIAVDGTVLGTIPPPFTLPPLDTTVIGPIGNEVHSKTYPTPAALVGDGAGTYWYLVNSDQMLREYIGSSTGVFQPLGRGDGMIEPVGSPVPPSDVPCPNNEPCGP